MHPEKGQAAGNLSGMDFEEVEQVKYCDIKKKMNKTDSMGLWDDKELIFTAADMHKMVEAQAAKTGDFYRKQISHMMDEHEIFQEFEKRAADLQKQITKIKEGETEGKEIVFLYESKLIECRIMQGLFQRMFTLKYLDKVDEEE